jgi:hypothetical protein
MQHGEYKDANDFLQAGKGADFKNLMVEASQAYTREYT